MLLKLIPSRRLGNFLGFLVCAGLIGYALYLQYYQFQVPCPLCILQRIAVIVMGVMFLLASVFHPKGQMGAKIWGGLIAIPGLLGLGVAARHLYIQSLPPDKVPACGPGLEYMLETMPWASALAKALRGSGECAEASWRLLGLTIPGWMAVCFVGLLTYTILVVYKDLKHTAQR
ncbi:disulfide bond formation protein DsbB [Chitinivorax tropicus]|uniref:Disulfide bond formation protein B n=1 Tax=Chitinivorax tropicus TaxID=714531 RepID=A0A840MQD5_9PROT|nr:disulfide bond formation protein B [Chitinivorax tropicus]MBB5018982.1 disulfide bond formation protein DsbB [Chitinivorax tropicus]